MTLFVLDTSAILAVLSDEPGAERVTDLLSESARAAEAALDGDRALLPFMALMELEYLTRRRFGAEEARRVLQLVRSWPVVLVDSDARWRHEAARVKSSTPLSVADAWISSLALLHDAILVHKDPELDAVDGLRAERLPFKEQR